VVILLQPLRLSNETLFSITILVISTLLAMNQWNDSRYKPTHFAMYNRVQGRMAFLVSQWKKNSSLPTPKASREIKNWYFTLKFLP
jgi:hypothetical protein